MPVSAQVTVELTQEQDQFLPAESLPLAVRITNRSGQDLRLGRGEDWLTFSVESREGEVVPRLGEVPVAGEFVLESSRVATLRVDLAPYFALSRSGRYSVTATMRIKDWNQRCTEPAQRLRYHRGRPVVGAGNRRAQFLAWPPTPRRKSASSSCSRPITLNPSSDFMCA